jgi:hydrogenase large subunit
MHYESQTVTPAPQPGTYGQRVDFDPVTRVAGALAFRTVVDTEAGQVLDAASVATLFRGYENVLKGRDPRDAIFISSRACGVCGGVHATASALCLEMAFEIYPPPAGITARNLLVALEYLYDHTTQMFMRAGPDYSEPVVKATNPELWERAEQTPAPGQASHGFARIADIMRAMTPFTGGLHAEALDMARRAREAYVIMGGKYPHPQTLVPGGISSRVDRQHMNLTWLRIVPFVDYGKKVVAIWDDIVDFFLESNPRFAEVGAGQMNFIDLGQWDDPYAYDGTFQNASAWGDRRWATPGAIVGGQLRTTDLHTINRGIEEFVGHSFYEDWAGGGGQFSGDPAGGSMSPNHPWNKETLPQPGSVNVQGKYSWSTAARWERTPMDTGAYSRLWVTAMANRMPHRRFIEPNGHSLGLNMPKGALPEAQLEWHVPRSWGALERNRARAYALAYTTMVAYDNVLVAYDCMRKGGADAGVFTPYTIPKDFRVGVGFWGGARGALAHYMTLDDKVIQNYQIVGPSTFTASPMDSSGTRGPMEEALVGTPLLSTARPDLCIDALRTIRSFDPCMACATQ